MNAATLTMPDRRRLSRQCEVILARLQRGPATNSELAGLSLKYTSRLSDLRAAGYRVDCQRGSDGRNTYELVPTSEPIQLPMFAHQQRQGAA